MVSCDADPFEPEKQRVRLDLGSHNNRLGLFKAVERGQPGRKPLLALNQREQERLLRFLSDPHARELRLPPHKAGELTVEPYPTVGGSFARFTLHSKQEAEPVYHGLYPRATLRECVRDLAR